MMRWMGALFIIAGGWSCGGKMAKRYQMEEENLQQLERLLLWMQNELRCRCPDLCTLLRLAAERSIGDIQKIFVIFSEQIAERELTDLSAALLPVLQRHADIGKSVHQVLQELVKAVELDGKIIRPAQVVVCKGAAEEEGKAQDNEEENK